MTSEPKLLRHHPGTVTSIEIPINNGSFGEISFNSIVTALVEKSKIEELPSLRLPLSSSSSAIFRNDPQTNDRKHRLNHYDNIIERLEKKYSSQMIIAEGEESSDEDYEGMNAVDAEGVEGNSTIAKRKKRSNPYDAYDFDDSFVDDSDEIAQVNAELKKRKLKTVHGGFFVSSGVLEVEKGPDVIGKKKQATEIVRQKAKVVKSLPEAAKASAPLVPSVQESEKKAGALQQTPLLIPSVAAGAEQMSGTTPRVRIVKPKPLWTPCPATLSAIETFRVAVQELRGSLSKTGFLPQQLEQHLWTLDRTIRKLHGMDSLRNTSGYMESVSDILGEKVSTARVAKILSRLRSKEDSQECFAAKEAIAAQLRALMRANTITIAPMQSAAATAPPVTVIARVPSAVQPSSISSSLSTVSIPSSSPISPSSSIPSPSVLPSIPPSLPLIDSNSLPPLNLESVPVPVQGPPPIPSSIVYTSTIRWNVEMRAQLLELQVAVGKWIITENSYRLRLTVNEKKILEESEHAELSEKECVTAEIRLLLTHVPPQCQNANIPYLRKIIAAGKQRQKQKVSRLLAEQSLLNSNITALSSATDLKRKEALSSTTDDTNTLLPRVLPSSSSSSSSSSLSPSSFSAVPTSTEAISTKNSSAQITSPKKILVPKNVPDKKQSTTSAPEFMKNEMKKKVAKAHKKVTKKSKSIAATLKRFSLSLGGKKKGKKAVLLRATSDAPVIVRKEVVDDSETRSANISLGSDDNNVCGDFALDLVGKDVRTSTDGTKAIPLSDGPGITSPKKVKTNIEMVTKSTKVKEKEKEKEKEKDKDPVRKTSKIRIKSSDKEVMTSAMTNNILKDPGPVQIPGISMLPFSVVPVGVLIDLTGSADSTPLVQVPSVPDSIVCAGKSSTNIEIPQTSAAAATVAPMPISSAFFTTSSSSPSLHSAPLSISTSPPFSLLPSSPLVPSSSHLSSTISLPLTTVPPTMVAAITSSVNLPTKSNTTEKDDNFTSTFTSPSVAADQSGSGVTASQRRRASRKVRLSTADNVGVGFRMGAGVNMSDRDEKELPTVGICISAIDSHYLDEDFGGPPISSARAVTPQRDRNRDSEKEMISAARGVVEVEDEVKCGESDTTIATQGMSDLEGDHEAVNDMTATPTVITQSTPVTMTVPQIQSHSFTPHAGIPHTPVPKINPNQQQMGTTTPVNIIYNTHTAASEPVTTRSINCADDGDGDGASYLQTDGSTSQADMIRHFFDPQSDSSHGTGNSPAPSPATGGLSTQSTRGRDRERERERERRVSISTSPNSEVEAKVGESTDDETPERSVDFNDAPPFDLADFVPQPK